MNMSVVKGGSSANLLVKGMSTEWGRKLYGRTLLANIAQSIYKDRDAIVKGLRDSVRQQVGRPPGGRRRGRGAAGRGARRASDLGRRARPAAWREGGVGGAAGRAALHSSHPLGPTLRPAPCAPSPNSCAWAPPR
jgi:hypothetical protein